MTAHALFTAFVLGGVLGAVAMAVICAYVAFRVFHHEPTALRLTPRRVPPAEAPVFEREWLLADLAELDLDLRRLTPVRRRPGRLQ